MQKSSLAAPASTSEPHQTIDSSIKDPKESVAPADTKTVTIDASQPEEMKQSLIDKQASQMSKSQITFDPNY